MEDRKLGVGVPALDLPLLAPTIGSSKQREELKAVGVDFPFAAGLLSTRGYTVCACFSRACSDF